jgi:hypothetical protein
MLFGVQRSLGEGVNMKISDTAIPAPPTYRVTKVA